MQDIIKLEKGCPSEQCFLVTMNAFKVQDNDSLSELTVWLK